MFAPPLVAPADATRVIVAAERAARSIPPGWPLATSVAVNPFHGQANDSLRRAGARLARVAGAPMTLPRRWYAKRIAAGLITDHDLQRALGNAPPDSRPADLATLKRAAGAVAPAPAALPTIADLSAEVSGVDWPGLIAERFGAWAAAYFDEGQALWTPRHAPSAYAAWKSVALHDLGPEIAGLSGFVDHVSGTPEDAGAAIARATGRLGVEEAAMDTYFHRLLMTLGGWGQLARYRHWQAERLGGSDRTIVDCLAIRLIWEEVLYARFGSAIGEQWRRVRSAHASPVEPTPDLAIDLVLQEAAERAAQRALATTLATTSPTHRLAARPSLQAVFCIDVRSEPLRRALESVDPGIQTLGFAGFFGMATAHHGFASDVEELRLPVLLNPAFRSRAGAPDAAESDRAARIKARARRAWSRFKLAAISSFAFVEATGPLYLGKLVTDALGLAPASPASERAPCLDPLPDLAVRIATAESVLRAMSLTAGFARLVLLTGHRATVVNNPHASALQCGACGGYPGEVNARLLASMLNDPAVRAGLSARGIEIPADTLFAAALHDTTTDRVVLHPGGHGSEGHRPDIERAMRWLAAAGRLARAERVRRLPHAGSERTVSRRSRDWAETRPEWGLAGCMAFIAAPRRRTAGKNLQGRVFLHDYDWRQDAGFKVLEQILTAPVVVAGWISLQYYGSTVAPEIFGSGNKLLHNVSGGIGVVEGNAGLLRAGLPWQSVHDGEDYAHEPLRLSVCIEARPEPMTDILDRHAAVRALFDNGWLHLFSLDETGRLASRYAGGGLWIAEEARPAHRAPARHEATAMGESPAP